MPRSALGFEVIYQGTSLHANFNSFSATIEFDPENLDDSLIDVTVALADVVTNSSSGNEILLGSDFFDAASFPTARYRAARFSSFGGYLFEAAGDLVLRGVSRPVNLKFVFFPGFDAGEANVEGGAELQRLDFGVGQGDWADTSEIENEVVVSFSLKLKRVP